jgi:DNA phosphorothioation-associated DGQHR protein 1
MPFLKLFAFKVSQPLGDFYLTKLPAEDLIKISYSSQFRPKESEGNGMQQYIGSQREKKTDKLKQIGRYIDSVEAAFPNTIILAANYLPNGELVEEDELRWSVNPLENGLFELIIPTREKLAAIVDGQHRLDGFNYAENSNRWTTDLACAVYLDLPNPYQAYLFSSINHNQTPVSKSLSYFLYGYNLDDESADEWSPEKLAVFISRQLNAERESPFYMHIKIAPQIDKILTAQVGKLKWAVSTATIVEGILNLITADAGRDRDELAKIEIKDGRNRKYLNKFNDDSPLRSYFLYGQDKVIRKSVENFFEVAFEHLGNGEENENSFVKKTIGIQALFDVLKETLKVQPRTEPLNISITYYENLLSPLFVVNFMDDYLLQSSAIGRNRLKNFILYALGYRTEFDQRDQEKPEAERRRIIKAADKEEYDRLLNL